MDVNNYPERIGKAVNPVTSDGLDIKNNPNCIWRELGSADLLEQAVFYGDRGTIFGFNVTLVKVDEETTGLFADLFQ